MIEEILVQYNDSDAALFGPDNDLYGSADVAASKAKFAEMLRDTFEETFPFSIIKFQTSQSGSCEAWRHNGDAHDGALALVREILNETWASFNWLVD